MRAKQLALMRERNLFLEKCRRIEKLGESMNWQEKGDTGLIGEVHQVLYQAAESPENSTYV
jgi:hypothetical protein